jgi:hypothetical protein
VNIISELQSLAQSRGYSLIHVKNLTLETVHALVNHLKNDQPLDEKYQYHLCEQVSATVYIDQVPVATKQIEITNANILSVTVGSTGYMGGDTGHGGRTYFAIKDEASTDLRLKVNNGHWQEVESIEIALGGDTELETFMEALKFGLDRLKFIAKENQ